MRGIRALFVLLVVGSIATAVAYSASSRSHAISHPGVHACRLTAQQTDNWVTARGDIFNRQYSAANAITKDNVKGLKVAWHTRVLIPTKGKPNFTGSFAEAEPVVYGGTMYMPDTKGNVYAFDAVTGERLWYYKPKYPKNFSAGLPTSRGVVIGDGKVFMAQTDASVVGLDQSTGRVAWKTVLGDYKQGYFFTSPPTYINGMLIVGTSGGDFGARCKVVALDGKTGRSSGRSSSSRRATSSAPKRGRRTALTWAAAPSGHRSPSTRPSAWSTSASVTPSPTTATSGARARSSSPSQSWR